MLYCVEMEVNIPETWDEEKIKDYITREQATSQKYQKSGEWVYLWRVAGQYSNISILNVESPDELHKILTELPLFPYMDITVKSLCKHPNAIRESMI
ncbi:muconolactone Delta-isomerase family protein [Muricauda sp. 334s03]|uniref:Muconolactone Delta-isomerase n=1 Tax=Flagellimonas yonaguniensis TaxID=3031325 RepID=A0ABT5Y226_9FLAO|nr:muconolactone Delta-isomerase family protein [[Muricauda] yonaguniensis]MDF0717495.1 muconolactone Delta-isomerase family protein [[Muricauda] yonaguniensis]